MRTRCNTPEGSLLYDEPSGSVPPPDCPMFRPTPLILRAVVLAALVLGLLAVSTVPASAEPPPPARRTGDRPCRRARRRGRDVEAAIERTLEENGVQAWVLFVESTDGQPATEYATETARINSLGADDALLLVALEDRTDAIWVSEGLDAITDEEIDAIIADELEPRLRDGDFSGAAVATVEALGAANDTSPPRPNRRLRPCPSRRPARSCRAKADRRRRSARLPAAPAVHRADRRRCVPRHPGGPGPGRGGGARSQDRRARARSQFAAHLDGRAHPGCGPGGRLRRSAVRPAEVEPLGKPWPRRATS